MIICDRCKEEIKCAPGSFLPSSIDVGDGKHACVPCGDLLKEGYRKISREEEAAIQKRRAAWFNEWLHNKAVDAAAKHQTCGSGDFTAGSQHA